MSDNDAKKEPRCNFPGHRRAAIKAVVQDCLDCGLTIVTPVDPCAASVPEPIPMVLHCPQCSRQHIDAPQPEKEWDNPPHRSHECQFCGHVWRPADVPTTGVQATQTHGSRDAVAWSYNAAPVPAREWVPPDDLLVTLRHARVFITSREKMHPAGVELYDRLIAKLEGGATLLREPLRGSPDVSRDADGHPIPYRPNKPSAT